MTMTTVGFYGGKFLTPHMGHVWCITKASTMVDELHVIITYDDDTEKSESFNGTVVDHVPVARRHRWINMITRDMPNVTVHVIHEPQTWEEDDWKKGAALIRKAIGKPIDKVFGSEPSYGEYFSWLYPEAEHVILDEHRTRFPISSTDIRSTGILANWDMIPPEVRRDYVKKVCVLGTESNGKSTLVKNLARVFSTNYVGEYGRELFEEMGSYETFPEDYRKIAVGHAHKINEAVKDANKVLFVDTDAHVTRNFLVDYLDIYDDAVVNAVAATQDFDLVLFLEPDVKWVDDGTRILGGDDQRSAASERLKSFLDDAGVEYVTVSGSYEQRFATAEAIVNDLIA